MNRVKFIFKQLGKRQFNTQKLLRNAENPQQQSTSSESKQSKQQAFEQRFQEEEEPEQMKKQEKQKIGWAIGLGLMSSYLYLGWGEYDTNQNIFMQHNQRAFDSIKESYEYFMHPPKKALLPPLPKSLHRDFTLCVELSDVLTHLVWEVIIIN